MVTAVKKRPQAGSATGRIWEIADQMLRDNDGVLPTGRQVVDAYLAEDSARNEGTGFTQYSHWKTSHLAHFERGPRPRTLEGGAVRVTVGPDGRLVIPASLRDALNWQPGEELILTRDGGGLRVEPRKAALERAQALVAAFDTGSGSPTEELLAERRQDAGRGE